MKLLVRCLLALCLVACAFGQEIKDNPRVHIVRPYGQQSAPPPAQTITYNGGPILNSTSGVNVYVVYYGTFTSTDTSVLNGMLSTLGNTPLYKINTTYFDSSMTHINGIVNFNSTTNVFNDNYSLGKNLSDANVQTIVKNAINGGHLPNDTNGIYFVLTATDVKETDSAIGGSFCTVYCGYHGPSTTIITGETLKYSFVGNAATQCPSGCIGNVAIFHDTTSPNNDLGADGMASVIFHELSESVTDPEVNLRTAWAGSCGENGDCCNFIYGSTKIVTNGSHANVKFGGKFYLLQEMFKLTQQILPTDQGVCAKQ
jgi:hypothetical protein